MIAAAKSAIQNSSLFSDTYMAAANENSTSSCVIKEIHGCPPSHIYLSNEINKWWKRTEWEREVILGRRGGLMAANP